jgi:acyl dehydratase
MLEVQKPKDLAAYAGQDLGVSDWVVVEQRMIDLFAEATGDDQWIHVDVERAKREMPGGKTIAHGLLTISLAPRLSRQVYLVRERSRSLNYGSNKVRFLAPVPAGARIRVRVKLNSVEPVEGGYRFYFENTIELEGSPRPAAVAEFIAQMYD